MAVQISGNDITVPRDTTVTRNLTVGGVLTYEDVTNVDSVGLVTARSGIEIGARPGVAASISVDGNMIISGISTFGDDITFTGATSGRDVVFDTSLNQIRAQDNAKLCAGSSSDLEIYHNATNSFLDNYTGALFLRNNVSSDNGGNIVIQAKVNEDSIVCNDDGAVELYYDNSKKIETTSSGVSITGNCNVDGNVILSDSEEIQFGNSTDFRIYHDGTNSYIRDVGTGVLRIASDQIQVTNAAANEVQANFIEDGAVELYHNNVKKIETAAEGVVIPSGGGNCLRVFGQNTYHAASALVIGQNSTTVSQLRAYGPNTSTNGEINFRSSRSDGSNSVNMTYNGNLQFDSGYGIDFSATSDYTGAGSGTPSELFDDYEEGTWTPRYQTSNGNWSGGMSNQDGSYTKVGNLVHIRFRIHWSSVGGSGTFRITALPFTIANTSSDEGGGVTIGWRSGFNYPQVVSFFRINNQQIQFGYISSSSPYGAFDISVGALASTGYVYCSGTYGAA